MKWASEGGVAKSELESPSLDSLSSVSPHVPFTLVTSSWLFEVESLSSAARISSSSLDVGLGTRNELGLAADVGISGRWLDCGDF